MKRTHLKETKAVLSHIESMCETLTEAQDELQRTLLERIAGKWAFWILCVVAQSPSARFSHIHRSVEGISQKMLTQNLRQLETDKFITRKVYAEVPPRVEYAITPLGEDLIHHVAPLWTWVFKNLHRFGKS